MLISVPMGTDGAFSHLIGATLPLFMDSDKVFDVHARRVNFSRLKCLIFTAEEFAVHDRKSRCG